MSKRFVAFTTFSALAVLLCDGPVCAETGAGFFGGAAFSKLAESPLEEGVSLGTGAGLAAGGILDVGLGSRFSLRLEPGYVERRPELTFEPDGFLFRERMTASIRLGYVEMPVLLTVKLGSGGARPYLMAGPSVGYLTKARAEAEGESEDVKESLVDWDFGVGAGAGLEFGRGRTRGFVEARYTWGLTNLNAEQGASDDSKVKNRGAQVLAGVTFALGR